MRMLNRFLHWYFAFRLRSSSYRLKIYRKALKRKLHGTRAGRILLRNLGRVMAQDTSLHNELSALVGPDNYQKCFWQSDLGYNWFQDTIQSQNKYFEFALREIKTNNLQSVLDVGCGWGRFCSEAINAGLKDCKGIDISAEIIAKAKEHFPQQAWAFEHKDVLEEMGKYDLITLFGSADYIPPAIYKQILEHVIIHANREVLIVNSLRGIPFERAMLLDEPMEVKRYDDGYLQATNHLLKDLQQRYSFTYDICKYGADSLLARILKH